LDLKKLVFAIERSDSMDFLKGIYYGVLEFDKYSICFALLILITILCFTRAMLNMAILCIVVAAILIGVCDYSPQDIYYKAQSAIEHTKESAKKYIEPILESQLADAEIRHHEDGSYEILAGEITVEGKKGEQEVTVHFKGEELVIGIEEFSDELSKSLEEINQEEKPAPASTKK
jgi:hypothetical protein